MEEQLQLEETQRTNLQAQDQIPHDPNAASRPPGGYTSVGEGEDNTQVEEVDPVNVGAVEVSNPQVEDFRNGDVLGSSGDSITGIDIRNNVPEVLDPLQIVSNQNASLDPVLGTDGNIVGALSDIPDPGDEVEVVDPPVVPPVDPPLPPVDPPVVPPVDPPVPPVDPPVDPDPEDPDPEDPDPEDPDPEDPDPEDPDPEDPDPEDPDPEDPDPEDPDPEDPDPEDPGNGNPGNDKEVGNSPWDGETGASDNPGNGNHQDGLDPETNQPPGDANNNGGQGNNPQNDNDNEGGGGKPEKGENNGFGNGDDDAPGNSGPNNNAENAESPNSNIGDLIHRFVEENPGTEWYENLDNQYDDYEPEDTGDVNIPDVPEPVIDFEIADYADDPGGFDFS